MQFDKGYLSPYFVTNPETMECVLEEPYILIHEKKRSNVKDFLPLLEAVAKSGKPLLIIAEDVEGEALSTLVINRLRGTFACCTVKAPAYGDRRKAMLEDIAILTGGTALFDSQGIKLENLKLANLGRAKKVIIDRDPTLIQGAGKSKDIKGWKPKESSDSHEPSYRLMVDQEADVYRVEEALECLIEPIGSQKGQLRS